MKGLFITLIICCRLIGIYAQDRPDGHFNLLIGTYTDKDSDAESIYVFDFNASTGKLVYRSGVRGIANPSFLAISRDRTKMYAVSELGKGKGGVNAFHFDDETGALSYINCASSGGSGPCYVSVDRDNQLVFSANYGSGSISACRVLPDGSLDSTVQIIQHNGKSIAKDQAGPHAHSILPSPDGRYLLSADLGVDKIFIYGIDRLNKNPLQAAEQSFISVKPGSGPRHITFHPNGKYVYAVNELSGSVTAFRYKNGRLKYLQEITMLAPNFQGVIEAADLHISPDGRFLYATNREESNELLIYSISKKGMLTYAGRHSTLGKGPRSFTLDPTGNFVLIANLNSDNIQVFSRNKKTGQVLFAGTTVQLKRPACLKFAAIPYQ